MLDCAAYAHIPDTQRKKLDKKAEKFRFVGYSIQSKAYQLLDEQTAKVYIRRDVVFNEEDLATYQGKCWLKRNMKSRLRGQQNRVSRHNLRKYDALSVHDNFLSGME